MRSGLPSAAPRCGSCAFPAVQIGSPGPRRPEELAQRPSCRTQALPSLWSTSRLVPLRYTPLCFLGAVWESRSFPVVPRGPGVGDILAPGGLRLLLSQAQATRAALGSINCF